VSTADAATPATAAGEAQPVEADDATLQVVFDVNSSYFSRSATDDLSRFVADLGPNEGYLVELKGSIGGGDVSGKTPAEAARYNRWLAERRVVRVQEWLERHATGRVGQVTHSYVENDASRRVTVRMRPFR
jgi:hypothetical protein